VVDRAAPGADDTNPGTAEKPHKTIGHAGSAVQPGDTVLVMAGRYDEQPRAAAFSGRKRIRLRANHVRVEGFEITAEMPAVAMRLGGSYCEVVDNDVHDMTVGVAGTVGKPSSDGATRDYAAVARNRVAYNRVYHSQYGFVLGGNDWLGGSNEVNRLFMYTPGNRFDDCDYSRFFSKGSVQRYKGRE